VFSHRKATSDENPYLPKPARIIKTLPQIPDHQLFQIRFEEQEMAESFRYREGLMAMVFPSRNWKGTIFCSSPAV